MENEAYWQAFESTGDIKYYLRYKQSENANPQEAPDANYNDGASNQRD